MPEPCGIALFVVQDLMRRTSAQLPGLTEVSALAKAL
jgi:hypothetical protein